jgi:hypothetical protein
MDSHMKVKIAHCIIKGSIFVFVALIKIIFNLGLLYQLFPTLWKQDPFVRT